MDPVGLGTFLRTRRSRLRPSDVGLPAGPGRRAEGLRREEVAVLANIGVSWLTRLEQGRANAVSADVLAGLADALRLSVAERRHLFDLAGVHPPAEVATAAPSDALARLVAGLDPNPAYVLDPAWHLVCWNRAETALFPVLRTVAPGEANLLRLTLTTEELRTFMADWAEEVDRLVRQFRLHLGQFPTASGSALAEELRAAHPEFAAAWSRHDVAVFTPKPRQFDHREVGSLVFDHHRLAVPDHPGWTVVIYTPADATTRERFRRVR